MYKTYWSVKGILCLVFLFLSVNDGFAQTNSWLNNSYYRFQSDALMSYHDLRNYIHTHKHLPNVPTAQEIEENGADLGEINRILVEKVEELTLYILELEDRLSAIENEESPTKAEENTLLERISRLENLLEQIRK
jgi:hypothetical protein